MKNRTILLDYTLSESPHLLIEVNQKCDLSCSACYKKRSDYQKDFKQIKDDIDFGLQKRKPDLITFAGGEPTLNDDLESAIKYVSGKKINTVILSNGLNISEEKLKKYKTSGLYMIYYHIDSMQNRSDVNLRGSKKIHEKDLNSLRDKIFEKTYNLNIKCGLCMTLYKSRLNELPDIINYVLSSVYLKGLLSTGYIDINSMINKYIEFKNKKTNEHHIKNVSVMETSFSEKVLNKSTRPSGRSFPEEVVKNQDIEKIIYEKFGIKPDFYIPSSNNIDKSWIIYYVIVIIFKNGSYKMYNLSYNAKNFLDKMNNIRKFFSGRIKFVIKMKALDCILICILSGLLSFNIKYFIKSISFLFNLFKKESKILFKDLVFQQGPEINENGELIYCKSCPDATVRNSKLMPVCLADFIEPLDHL